MPYLKFKNDTKVHDVTIRPAADNRVEIVFTNKIVKNLSGFEVYKDKEATLRIGNYPNHNFIYRDDEETEKTNSIILSSRDEVYQPLQETPEAVAEITYPEITLEELKTIKQHQLEMGKQAVLNAGYEVNLSIGMERFTCTTEEFSCLVGMLKDIGDGKEKIPWHTADKGQYCKYYSIEDMTAIIKAAQELVNYHIIYLNSLLIYMWKQETREAVENITYGMSIPETERSEVLSDYYAALEPGL